MNSALFFPFAINNRNGIREIEGVNQIFDEETTRVITKKNSQEQNYANIGLDDKNDGILCSVRFTTDSGSNLNNQSFNITSNNPDVVSIEYIDNLAKFRMYPKAKGSTIVTIVSENNISFVFTANVVVGIETTGVDGYGNPIYSPFTQSSITSITLPNTIALIGCRAFYGCKSLKRVVFPQSLKVIEEAAFEYCSNLDDITLPQGLTFIGGSAFDGCNFKKLVIPNSVDSIDHYAFNWSNLKEVVIEDGTKPLYFVHSLIPGLDPLPFGMSPLEKVYIGRNITRKSAYLWSPFSHYQNGGVCISELTIGKEVSILEKNLFEHLPVKSVSFVNGKLHTIEEDVFHGCDSLKNITIPSSVKNIGKYAFMKSGLTTISIPNSVVNIGDDCFRECESLKTAIIGNSLKTIPNSLFAYCSNLESITIGKKVESIEYNAFYNCSKLKGIDIPGNVKRVESPFYGCSGLSYVLIRDGVKYIELGVSYNENIKSLVIPNSVDTIKAGFYECPNMKEIIIEDGETILYCSLGGENVDTIYLGRNYYTLNSNMSCFCYSPSLISLGIGSYVNSLPDYAFAECGIKKIVIPNGVTTLEKYAFYACSDLETVIIPKTMISIGPKAFSDCYAIKEIQVQNPTPPTITTTTFSEETEIDATLYVPSGSLSLYKEAPYWKNFLNIKEIGSTTSIAFEKEDNNTTLCQVWNLNGVCLASINMNDIENILNHLSPGVYIIKCNNKAQKIIVK